MTRRNIYEEGGSDNVAFGNEWREWKRYFDYEKYYGRVVVINIPSGNIRKEFQRYFDEEKYTSEVVVTICLLEIYEGNLRDILTKRNIYKVCHFILT